MKKPIKWISCSCSGTMKFSKNIYVRSTYHLDRASVTQESIGIPPSLIRTNFNTSSMELKTAIMTSYTEFKETIIFQAFFKIKGIEQ